MKKVFATLMATALLGATCIGFAACGGLSIPKGDEVSEEQWIEALSGSEATIKNYTQKSSSESEESLNGTAGKYKWDYDNYTYKKIGNSTVKVKKESSDSLNVLYDEKGERCFGEYKETSQSSVKADDKKESKSDSKETSKIYYELSEEKEGNKKYWRAEYSETDSSSSSESGKSEKYEKENWEAVETGSFVSNSLSITYSFYETNEGTQSKNISELYDKFTYSKGVYTATLYKKVNFYYNTDGVHYDIYDYVACTVTVSINAAEKCVIGFGWKCDAKGSLTKEDDENRNSCNLQYSYKENYVGVITNINKTDASKKANKDITKAIEKAKKEKAENSI